ncbi:TIGR02757 family protein [Desulfosarcina alkanivorans]|uniref:TIGR02757 family protein n=1 Tax=Desulfosarcina alkanivorans TaxID=571177 RepID=A0A5K7YIZ1_9BACT|nr:TIGR02757 family protein [Desulfosarcina alkanivorans]BBO68878.1 TIGR02757 family protein [Desulfosarcina alkanivorans]
MGILKPVTPSHLLVDRLEQIYRQYHRRAYVDPDPLTFLYDWDHVRDREIVGLVAASLAYGRVVQILKSVSAVLEKIGPSPYHFVTRRSLKSMRETFLGFRHRFADGDQMAALLYAAGRVIRQFGSLENGLAEGLATDGKNLHAALGHLYRQLTRGRSSPGHLLPDPGKGSACKRLHLYLRWMVRKDQVDPGGWQCVAPSDLIVPLDIHMHTVGRRLGFTRRRQADLRTALEITDGFKEICSQDPVRFDFSLTRLGIRSELDMTSLPLHPA